MSARIPQHLETVLNTIAAKLVSDQLFDTSAVYLHLVDDEAGLIAPTDQYVAIAPAAFQPDLAAVAGGGLDAPFTAGQTIISLWSRLHLDETYRAGSFLTHSSLGIIPKFRGLVNSLQLYDPLDLDGNYILAEPMRLVSYQFLPARPQSGWGRVRATFETNYLEKLS